MITKVLYGYRKVNGDVEIDPDAAERIRRFFALANSGIPIREAATTAGIVKTISFLHKMLKNPAYAGKGDYPAIVPPEQVGVKVAHKRMVSAAQRPIPILTGFRYGIIPEADEDVNPADYVAKLYDCIEAELATLPAEPPAASTASALSTDQPTVGIQPAAESQPAAETQPAEENQPAVESMPAAEDLLLPVEIAVPENPAAPVVDTEVPQPTKAPTTISLSFDPTPVKSENESATIAPTIPITTFQTTLQRPMMDDTTIHIAARSNER